MQLSYQRAAMYLDLYRLAEMNFGEDGQKRFLDALRLTQVKGKEWLVTELTKHVSVEPLEIEIVGGWFGFPLIDMLYDTFSIDRITIWDIDPMATTMQSIYKEVSGFEFVCVNGNYWNKQKTTPDVVINCCAEHMTETFASHWTYDNNPLIAIQSTNADASDHCNQVNSPDEIERQNYILNCKYKGSIPLHNGKERFMVIGYAQ